MPPVSNPLNADLNAGGHRIYNGRYEGASFITGPNTGLDGQILVVRQVEIDDDPANPTVSVSLFAGAVDPNTAEITTQPGSLYLRQYDGVGELWCRVSGQANGWTKIAG